MGDVPPQRRRSGYLCIFDQFGGADREGFKVRIAVAALAERERESQRGKVCEKGEREKGELDFLNYVLIFISDCHSQNYSDVARGNHIRFKF